MSTFIIEEIKRDHVDDILLVSKSNSLDHIFKEHLNIMFSISPSTSFVCKDKNRIIGYIICIQNAFYDISQKAFVNNNKYNMIYSLTVEKEFRNKGIAKELMRRTLVNSIGKIVQLQVRKNNHVALYLYEYFRFNISNTLKDYYPSLTEKDKKEDGYVIECNLQSDFNPQIK